jgi:hypothetical protein
MELLKNLVSVVIIVTIVASWTMDIKKLAIDLLPFVKILNPVSLFTHAVQSLLQV